MVTAATPKLAQIQCLLFDKFLNYISDLAPGTTLNYYHLPSKQLLSTKYIATGLDNSEVRSLLLCVMHLGIIEGVVRHMVS